MMKLSPIQVGEVAFHIGPVNEINGSEFASHIAGPSSIIGPTRLDCGDAGHILLSHIWLDDLEAISAVAFRFCTENIGTFK